MGAVPIPETVLETRLFLNEISQKTKQGRFVHVYPEGELIFEDSNIRDFKNGAFKIAVDSGVPIIPVRISFLQGRFRKKIILNVGEPLYPDVMAKQKDAQMNLKNKAFYNMAKL